MSTKRSQKDAFYSHLHVIVLSAAGDLVTCTGEREIWFVYERLPDNTGELT